MRPFNLRAYTADMDTASEILVIIVSAVLAVFLVVAIIALVAIIKLVKQVKQITAHAENVAESMESAASAFQKTATPLAFLKIIGNIVEHAGRARKRR